jgi:uncharacterized membrane protein SpoIIM required for sporulation
MGLVMLIVVIPGLIWITVSGVGILLAYYFTSAIKNEDARNIVRALLYICIVCLSIYALTEGMFSPRLPAWH